MKYMQEVPHVYTDLWYRTTVLRTPAEHGSALQAALRSRGSLQILYFFLTCGLNAFLSPTHSTKKKSLCFAQAFLCGGNGGARTRDLTDVNRAL